MTRQGLLSWSRIFSTVAGLLLEGRFSFFKRFFRPGPFPASSLSAEWQEAHLLVKSEAPLSLLPFKEGAEGVVNSEVTGWAQIVLKRK